MKLHNMASSYNFSNRPQISSKKSEARSPQLPERTDLRPLRQSSLQESRENNNQRSTPSTAAVVGPSSKPGTLVKSQTGTKLAAANPKYTPTNREPGRVAIIEFEPDDNSGHDELVDRIVTHYNPTAPTAVLNNYAGYDISTDPIQTTARVGSLNRMIDETAINVFGSFTKKVNHVVNNGTATVINGSLGLSRNDLYVSTLTELQRDPSQASQIPNLTPADIKNLVIDSDGATIVTEKVSNAIVKFVDGRLDAKGSAFNRARSAYQKATKNAEDKGIAIVVAIGNEHKLNKVFPRGPQGRQLGGDTNWLAQSDNVISVAASDDNNTSKKDDDTIATFSSRGDGKFNPTVAANGVNVLDTENNGTSFAAPQVAAAISFLQKLNPTLTVAEIKNMLKNSATDSPALPRDEGDGIFYYNKAFDYSFLRGIAASA